MEIKLQGDAEQGICCTLQTRWAPATSDQPLLALSKWEPLPNEEFVSGQANVINAGTAVCSWRARIPRGRSINPTTAPNPTGNRLNTQQEWEHKENAVSSAVLLGGKSQRCDNFSSVMQGLQQRREQSLSLCFTQHKISSFHLWQVSSPLSEQQPPALDGAREKI